MKDFWFFITIMFSLILSFLYMLIYHVNPWDKYKDLSRINDQVKFYSGVGYSLLEKGHYALAKKEFEKAIAMRNFEIRSITGKYLTELFLEFDNPLWQASVGIEIKSHLYNYGLVEELNIEHIVEKYYGDLYSRIGDYDKAKDHYEKAIQLKNDYIDALFSYAWLLYSFVKTDSLSHERMITIFQKMTEVDPFDYRGFHGLGYALYIKAIKEYNRTTCDSLLMLATDQSLTASNLYINQINIVADLGEIARSIDPQLSILYHEHAFSTLQDPNLNSLPGNQGPIIVTILLATSHLSEIDVVSDNHKRSWLYYQLALDYQSLGITKKRDYYFKLARKLDTNSEMYPIYEDQLAVLNLLNR